MDQSKPIAGKILVIKDKGFGFITSKELPFKKIFFHWTALSNETLNFTELKPGMKVLFNSVELDDGSFKAINVIVDNTDEVVRAMPTDKHE